MNKVTPKYEGIIRLFEEMIDTTIDRLLGQWDIGYDELLYHLRNRWAQESLLSIIEDKMKDMGYS